MIWTRWLLDFGGEGRMMSRRFIGSVGNGSAQPSVMVGWVFRTCMLSTWLFLLKKAGAFYKSLPRLSLDFCKPSTTPTLCFLMPRWKWGLPFVGTVSVHQEWCWLAGPDGRWGRGKGSVFGKTVGSPSFPPFGFSLQNPWDVICLWLVTLSWILHRGGTSLSLTLFSLIRKLTKCAQSHWVFGNQMIVWFGILIKKKREFLIKSGYHVVLEWVLSHSPTASSSLESNPLGPLWKRIWAGCVPPNVKVYAWRICRTIIPTRANLIKRHLKVDDGCVLCGARGESALHLICDYPFAACVWMAPLGVSTKRARSHCHGWLGLAAWLLPEATWFWYLSHYLVGDLGG